MSKMNLLIDLKGYDGNNANTSRPIFSKNLQYVGIAIEEETIQEVTLAAAETKVIINSPAPNPRKFVYLETTGECDIILNGNTEAPIKKIMVDNVSKNGVYFRISDIELLEVTNNNPDSIKIFFITSK